MSVDTLTVGSLCSGYEGIGLGLAAVLPTELAWYAEFDDAPAKIMAHHHPDVVNYRDLTKIDWAALPWVHILSAGFPCQPFSHAGKRLGANDPRHLWPYIQQGIAVLRPRLVVLENVRGLLSGQGEADTEDIAPLADRVARIDKVIKARKARNAPTDHPYTVRLMALRKRAVGALRRARKRLVRAIGAVVGGLADVGYDAWWIGFRAADVGAAHGRWRVFIFATPADADDTGWVEHGRRLAVRAEQLAPQRVRADAATLTLLPTPAVNDMGAAYTPETWDAWTERMKAEHSNGNGHGKSLSIEAQRLLPTPTGSEAKGGRAPRDGFGDDLRSATSRLLATLPRATDGTKGGPDLYSSKDSVGDIVEGQDWREYEAAIRRQEAAFGRPAPPPTEIGAKGQPRLSPRFVEWLMGLPEGHVTDVGISRNDQLKALGNGVVPQQCAAAVRLFLSDLAQERAA